MNGLPLRVLLRMCFRSSFSLMERFIGLTIGEYLLNCSKRTRQKMPLVHLGERNNVQGGFWQGMDMQSTDRRCADHFL